MTKTSAPNDLQTHELVGDSSINDLNGAEWANSGRLIQILTLWDSGTSFGSLSIEPLDHQRWVSEVFSALEA